MMPDAKSGKKKWVTLCLVTLVILGVGSSWAIGAPMKFRLSTYSGQTGHSVYPVKWIAEQIELRSKGKVKVDIFWNNTLLKVGHEMEGISAGMADMAWVYMAREPAALRLSNVVQLPGLATDPRAVSCAATELNRTMQPLKDELARSNAVYIQTTGSELRGVMTKKPTSKIADLKGQKIWTSGFQAKALQKLGAAVVSFSGQEVREAGEKGVIDGMAASFGTATRAYMSPQEWTNTFFLVPLGIVTFEWVMNKNSFQKLPKDIQDWLTSENFTLHFSNIYHVHNVLGDTADGLKLWEAKGNKIVYPSDEEMAKVEKLLDPMYKDWIAETKAKGFPAQEVFDKWVKLLKKWQKWYKYPPPAK